MKKVLSILLAAVIAASCLAMYSVSAAAAETEKQSVNLLGDADLDGGVTIVDATVIQRYDVHLVDLTDKQLLAADVDGDDEVTILDVTWIQRWLASLSCPDGIDKPMNEVYKTKSIPVLRESLDSDETADLRFYADQPHVPYMNVTDFYNTFYLIATDLNEGMTSDRDGDKYTLTNIAGTSATFDVAEDTVYTENYEKFTQLAFSIQVEESGGVDSNYPFFRQIETNEPAVPTPITLEPGEYGIDLRGDDDGVYAPVATICDVFATTETFYVVYAGEKLYTKEFSGAHQKTAAMDADPDFMAAITEDHPADLADFTYRELCFNLDTWYGQPGQEYVHDDLATAKLDELLTEKYPQIKANLLSSDFKTFYTGMYHLINGLLCDGGHTTIASRLNIEDQPLVIEMLYSLVEHPYSEKFAFSNIKKPTDAQQRAAARDALYGTDYYIEQGDTAMIHFDKFIVDYDGWKAFYAGEGERPLTFETAQGTAYDTVGTVLSGLERAKQNPEIKNIVIDMSCNGGGDSGAMMVIEWLINGQGYVRYENKLTGCVKTTSAQFDMNFDGVFDENDVSPYTDYHYGVLTSSYAFSCGNAFPWFMHEHGAMILGEKTTGGACAIRLTSAAGIEFACSAASSRIVSDSGESVDFGCPIDVDLMTGDENDPYKDLYNMTLIGTKMNEYYSE